MRRATTAARHLSLVALSPADQLFELWRVLEQRGAVVHWIHARDLAPSTVGALIEEAEYRLRVLTEAGG